MNIKEASHHSDPLSANRIELGFFPTPLVPLSNLSAILGGPQICIKRDDLTGLGLGGNKTRKLEFILFDALKQGCDTVITAGAAQSNHCRQTAAAAAQLQMDCHLVLGGQAPAKANGNLLLNGLFGAHIHWSGPHRKGETIPEIKATLEAQGKRPYVIPYGGSNHLGALGFVYAMKELEAQTDASTLTHVVFASSSGGTHAGLLVGQALYQRQFQLVGIGIDKQEHDRHPFSDVIYDLAVKCAAQVNKDINIDRRNLILNKDYIGEGYGVIGQREKEAISLLAKSEGILLDPVYTGRAMAGLINLVRTGEIGKEDRVLFWHTGGAPALFAYSDSLSIS